MARLIERPKARQELEDISVYIGMCRPSAARRFLAAARKTYDTLASMPEMGSIWKSEDPRFQGLRYFPITRYPTGSKSCMSFTVPATSKRSWKLKRKTAPISPRAAAR